MNSTLPRRLVFAAASALAAAALAAPADLTPTASAATRALNNFGRTRDRIDALLKHRLHPNPLPATLPNPFQTSGGTALTETVEAPPADPVKPGPVAPEGPPAGSDADVLARFVARLKIGGTVELNGQLQLIINQSPYKEGDLIFLDNKNAVSYVQVIHITTSELTLGFNQAVQTVRFKIN